MSYNQNKNDMSDEHLDKMRQDIRYYQFYAMCTAGALLMIKRSYSHGALRQSLHGPQVSFTKQVSS